MSVLARQRLWLGLGLLAVLGVIVGSLHPAPPMPSGAPGSDKLLHLAAYGGLTLWFGQLGRRWHGASAIALLALGITLEFVQGLTPNRQTSLGDVVANSAGIAMAWLALRAGADRLGRRFLRS